MEIASIADRKLLFIMVIHGIKKVIVGFAERETEENVEEVIKLECGFSQCSNGKRKS